MSSNVVELEFRLYDRCIYLVILMHFEG